MTDITPQQRENLSELADRAEAAIRPDRILDRDIEIAIQNIEGQGHEDPRDNIRARKVVVSYGAQPHNYEVVAFSGVSLRTPREYTSSLDMARILTPEGIVARQYKAGKLVPHMWEVSRNPDHGGWIGNSDHASQLALIAANLRAYAALSGERVMGATGLQLAIRLAGNRLAQAATSGMSDDLWLALAAAFGPVLRDAFPDASSVERMRAGERLVAEVHKRESWFTPNKNPPTQGMSTRSAETEGLSPQDASPVRESECAKDQSQ